MPEKAAARPWTPTEEKFGSVVVKAMSVANKWIFRATGGKWGAKFMHGAPVLLLTTTGRKSGEERTTPLIYGKTPGGDTMVVASNGGQSPPAWWLNLQEDPTGQFQILGDRFDVKAREATPEEKPELWKTMTAQWPDYDDYQRIADREIPVVVLEKQS